MDDVEIYLRDRVEHLARKEIEIPKQKEPVKLTGQAPMDSIMQKIADKPAAVVQPVCQRPVQSEWSDDWADPVNKGI